MSAMARFALASGVVLLLPRLQALGLAASICFFLVAVAFRYSRSSPRSSFLLGCCTPWLAIFGVEVLLISALLTLILSNSRAEQPRGAVIGREALWLLGASLLVDVVWGRELSSMLQELVQGGISLPLAFQMVQTSPPFEWKALGVLLLFTCFFLFLHWWAEDEEERRAFGNGLRIGCLVALAASFVQVLTPLGAQFPNGNSFWTGVGRPVGAFTDPNAFGVFHILALPLLIEWLEEKWRQRAPLQSSVLLLGVMSWCWLGFESGSRSFVFGLALLIFFWVPTLRFRLALVVVGLVSIVTLQLAAIEAPDLVAFGMANLPVGLQRGLSTLLLPQAATMFESRAVFWLIAAHVWEAHFLVGVGSGHFASAVSEIAAQVAPQIGLWTDNANSFYLGIASELGFLGILAWGLVGRELRWRDGIDRSLRTPILVGLILLLLGPHLDFPEVALLSAFLVARACQVKRSWSLLSRGWVWLMLGVVVMVCGRYRDLGVYQWERGPKAEYLRWTGAHAQLLLPCCAGIVELQVRNPGAAVTAQTIRVSSSIDASVATLASGSERKVVLSCGGSSLARLELAVSRPWVPRSVGLGADGRLLGVQLVGTDGRPSLRRACSSDQE